jgi:hypothetical protein
VHIAILLDEDEGRLMVAAATLRRHKTAHRPEQGQGSGNIVLSSLHPAHRYGRSIFPSRVFDPDEVQRVLKDGHQSRKIGKFVTKGPRRGWPLFTLTLEERATCPRSCLAWGICYGNNMQAAERLTAGPALEEALWSELDALQRKHPGGFMVRLHVLGDFYSLGYVRFWTRALEAFPALHVFGFTAHDPASEMGAALLDLVNSNFDRFSLRFSGLNSPLYGSQLQPDVHPEAIPCPAQTGATDCCGTCGLCWHSRRSIAFARH